MSISATMRLRSLVGPGPQMFRLAMEDTITSARKWVSSGNYGVGTGTIPLPRDSMLA